MFSDLRAMRWNYWRNVLDASTHTRPWKWLYPRSVRSRICNWYEAWLGNDEVWR